jgi:RNA polymerase sigma-70 factor (ECF subfamily)
MDLPRPDPDETGRLLTQVMAGDRQALDHLLALHRGFLRRAVELRLDARVRARLDASDVVQEAQLEATQRIGDYLRRQPMPFHVWLEKTAFETLLRLRRQHVEAACRSVENEVPLPGRSSVRLAHLLLGRGPAPSQNLRDQELAHQVQQGMAGLSEEDREVLLLRGFEGLTNEEAGLILGIEPAAVSKRYTRALLRLRKLMGAVAAHGGEA